MIAVNPSGYKGQFTFEYELYYDFPNVKTEPIPEPDEKLEIVFDIDEYGTVIIPILQRRLNNRIDIIKAEFLAHRAKHQEKQYSVDTKKLTEGNCANHFEHLCSFFSEYNRLKWASKIS